jgi:hypothetical protein
VTKTTLTPTNDSTVTIVFGTGGAWEIDATALTSSDAFTVAVSGAPSSSYVGAFTLILCTNTTVPTITWPMYWAAPVIVAASENWYSVASRDGGTTWRTFQIGSF